METIQELNVIQVDLEIKNVHIFLDSMLSFGFGQNYHSFLHQIPQGYLSNWFFVFLTDFLKLFVGHEFLKPSGQRRICLNSDVLLLTELNGILLPEHRMGFNLIDHRQLLTVLNQVFQMSFHEITHPDIFDFSLFFKFDQSFPSLKSDLCVFGVINFELTDPWPMNQDKVKIATLQSFNDSEACLFCLLVSLLGRGDFTGYVKFFAINVELFEDLGNFKLVAVDTGSVNVIITNFQGVLKAQKAVIALEFVCTVAQNRDLVSAVKFDHRVCVEFLCGLLLHIVQEMDNYKIRLVQFITFFFYFYDN